MSDSLGNRSAFATPILAVAATNCCSACHDIWTALEQF